MTSVCPCCGGSLSMSRFIADINTNLVSYRGQLMELRPPKVMELVHLLARNWPATISFSDLAFGMWGMHEPDAVRNNLSVYALMARRELSRFGVEIEHVSKRGYRLTLPDQPLVTYTAQQRRTG